MSKNEKRNRGEQLSFYQLFSEKNWRIKIPIIQRDYAQGRDSAKEIRDAFLDTLYKHLSENKNIDLDFIYGSIEKVNNNFFIPLDGQQRLTTLFLLHWYLANQEDKREMFKDFMLTQEENKEISNFTYETRSSAREFCNILVKCNIDFDCLLENSLSRTIQDKHWYFSLWDNDPTIKAMLTMLDAMHKKFKGVNGFFEKLLDTENPVITFQFLNLEEFQLTDDLYIKMNARGKQLTVFENFKAKLEQLIKDLKTKDFTYKLFFRGEEREVTADEYFSYKIDNEWADLFWNYKDVNDNNNSFDDEIMNYIRTIISNQYSLDCKKSKENDALELLLDTNVARKKKSYTDNITYHRYEKMGVLNKKAIIYLIDALDNTSNKNSKINSYLENDCFYYDEKKVFKKILQYDLTFSDMVKFHAYIKFLIENEDGIEEIKQWMRVVHNLTENTNIDGADEFTRAIKSVQKLLPYSNDILNSLKNNDVKIDFFYSRQVQEERIKSSLIIKSSKWKSIIEDIEKNSYYKGQIAFILEFSGILSYYQNHKDCEWTDKEDKEFFRRFKEYSNKAKAIVPFLKKDKNNFDFLWERAVLTKGDYLIRTTAYRRNFLSTRRNIRDYSWKRLLRLPPIGSNKKDKWKRKRSFVKKVFDDPKFDSKKLKDSLLEICKVEIKDWRKHFVKHPELISYCKQGFIRFESESKISLFKESQRNHYHVELYSYLFYIKYLKDKNVLNPFTKSWYYSVKSRKDSACAVVDNWKNDNENYAIDIRYLSDNEKYEVRFFNRNNENIKESIKNIILKKGMKKSSKYDDNSYIILQNNEIETNECLNLLCNSLNEL